MVAVVVLAFLFMLGLALRSDGCCFVVVVVVVATTGAVLLDCGTTGSARMLTGLPLRELPMLLPLLLFSLLHTVDDAPPPLLSS